LYSRKVKSQCGQGDAKKREWLTNIHRDTLASHVGHYSRLAYFAIVENEPIAKIRYRCLQNMSLPIVPKPKKEQKQ
ncbi:splicing factor 3B subunit 5, putative, partial [Plasmodium ovale curtisi]